MYNSVGEDAQAIFVLLELEILCPGSVVGGKIGNPQKIGAEHKNASRNPEEANEVDFEEGEEKVNQKTPVPSSSTLLNEDPSSFSEGGFLETTNNDENGNVDSTESSGHVRDVNDDLGQDGGGGVDNESVDPGEGTSMQANDATTASSKLTKQKTSRSKSVGNYRVFAPSISIFHLINVFALNFRMFR